MKIHLSSFSSSSYGSKQVFSFCEENSLPSFLKTNHQSPLPLSLYTPFIDPSFYPDFDIYDENSQLKNFLSKFFGEKDKDRISQTDSTMGSGPIEIPKPQSSKRRKISSFSDFLEFIEDEANRNLEKGRLLKIHLKGSLEQRLDFLSLIRASISKDKHFKYFTIFKSFQDQIHPFLGHEVSMFFADSRAYFLKMFEILEEEVISKQVSNPFETISKEYVPKIVQTVRETVKVFYSDLGFGSFYGKL